MEHELLDDLVNKYNIQRINDILFEKCLDLVAARDRLGDEAFLCYAEDLVEILRPIFDYRADKHSKKSGG